MGHIITPPILGISAISCSFPHLLPEAAPAGSQKPHGDSKAEFPRCSGMQSLGAKTSKLKRSPCSPDIENDKERWGPLYMDNQGHIYIYIIDLIKTMYIVYYWMFHTGYWKCSNSHDPGLRRMPHCVLRRFGCGTTLALPLGLALLGCGVLGVGFADDGAKVLPWHDG